MEEKKKVNERKYIFLGVIGVTIIGILILLLCKRPLTDEDLILKYHKNTSNNRETYLVNSDLDLLKKDYDLYQNYVQDTEVKNIVSVMLENDLQSRKNGEIVLKIVDNTIHITFNYFEDLDSNHKLKYLNDEVISLPIEVAKSGLPLYIVNDAEFIYVITNKNVIGQYKFHFGDSGEVIEYSKFISTINDVRNTFTELDKYNYTELINYTIASGSKRNKVYGLSRDKEVINLVTKDSSGIRVDQKPLDTQEKYTIGNYVFEVDIDGKIKEEKSDDYLMDENNHEITIYAIFDYNFEDCYLVDTDMNVYKIADYRHNDLETNILKKESFKISKFLLINGNADFLIYDENGQRIDLDAKYEKRLSNVWIASSH